MDVDRWADFKRRRTVAVEEFIVAKRQQVKVTMVLRELCKTFIIKQVAKNWLIRVK